MKKFNVIFPCTIVFIMFLVALFFFVHQNSKKNHIKIGDTEITFEQEADGTPEQQLIVKAPETCVIGEMVTIDATASNCDTFEWLVIPETVDFRIITNGQEALFTSRTPGTYIFIIAGTRDGILMPLKEVTIIVEGSTPLPPAIVDNAFTIMVKSWLPANANPIILERLARSFERVASIAHEDIASLVKTTSLSNQSALGVNSPQYKPFLVAFSTHLKTNLTDATIDEHVKLWFNLADILREIK